MEVHFRPELESKLNAIANENSSDADGYVQQLVENYLEHDVWVRSKVRNSLDQLDRGDYITHEAVGERIDQMFRS